MIYDIREINVEGKTFLIVMLQVSNPIRDEKLKKKLPLLSEMYPYINSYVYIKGIGKYDEEVLGYPTLKRENIIGVDTAHNYNETQTVDERAEDSLRQIKDCIKCYLKEVSKNG